MCPDSQDTKATLWHENADSSSKNQINDFGIDAENDGHLLHTIQQCFWHYGGWNQWTPFKKAENSLVIRVPFATSSQSL